MTGINSNKRARLNQSRADMFTLLMCILITALVCFGISQATSAAEIEILGVLFQTVLATVAIQQVMKNDVTMSERTLDDYRSAYWHTIEVCCAAVMSSAFMIAAVTYSNTVVKIIFSVLMVIGWYAMFFLIPYNGVSAIESYASGCDDDACACDGCSDGDTDDAPYAEYEEVPSTEPEEAAETAEE